MEDDASVEVTRAQIEQTREEMSDTIEAIREKLNPQTLAEQAKEKVSDITTDVVEKAKSAVHDKVSGAVTEAKEAVGSAVSSVKETVGDAAGTVKDAGSTLVEMLRENAVPATLIALGVGWIWASQRRQNAGMRSDLWKYRRYRSPYDESTWSSESYAATYSQDAPHLETEGRSLTGSGAREKIGEMQDRVSRAAGQVQESMGDWGSRAGEYARGMGGQCRALMQERPLAAGAIALGLGAAIGLLIPETYRENRLMGEARDTLIGKVQDTAQDLATRAQIVAEEAIDTAKQEARNQNLTG
jgi:ElaB/YqjD/DUF883 family membrane-anchored ribosome-binding protein